MDKNIFKKFAVLLTLGFVLSGFGFAYADEEGEGITPPAGDIITCEEPKILNETGDGCVDPASDTETDSVDTIQDIAVKNGCTVTDTEGVEHIFPQEDSTSEFLGVCALVSAKDAGYISGFELTNDSSLGLYLSSFDGKSPGSTEYWALFLNDGYASCGIGCLPVAVNDKLSFILSDWIAGTESTKISFRISSLETIVVEPDPTDDSSGGDTGGGGNGGSYSEAEKNFSVPDAVSFLSTKQQTNGSFGDSLYTDWAAIAIGVGEYQNLKSSISDYLKNNQIDSSVITDYERRAMALMSLSIDPYKGTNVDYIKKITDSFDGEQIGEKSLFNDDIFGLIVLQNAGYNDDDEIIFKTIAFVLDKQSENGSWGSIDMTAAGVMALKDFDNVDGVLDAISKAESYLASYQKVDGSFDNLSSTSWAVQALSLFDSYGDIINKALKYLGEKQQEDGGLDGDIDNNRVWETSYAIPAGLKMSWNDILADFEKEEDVSSSSSGSGSVREDNEEESPRIVLATVSQDVEKVEDSVFSDSDYVAQSEPVENKIIKKPQVKKEVVFENNPTEEVVKEEVGEIDESNLLASAGGSTSNNIFGDKITIITIGMVIIVIIGGWLTNKYWI